MAKIKVISAIVIDIEKGLLVTDKGHKVFTSLMKKSKIGDTIEYGLIQGVVTKRFQMGNTQWTDSVRGGPMFYKQF